MVELEAAERYTANQSLKHPWITNETEILPLTFKDVF